MCAHSKATFFKNHRILGFLGVHWSYRLFFFHNNDDDDDCLKCLIFYHKTLLVLYKNATNGSVTHLTESLGSVNSSAFHIPD